MATEVHDPWLPMVTFSIEARRCNTIGGGPPDLGASVRSPAWELLCVPGVRRKLTAAELGPARSGHARGRLVDPRCVGDPITARQPWPAIVRADHHAPGTINAGPSQAGGPGPIAVVGRAPRRVAAAREKERDLANYSSTTAFAATARGQQAGCLMSNVNDQLTLCDSSSVSSAFIAPQSGDHHECRPAGKTPS